MMYIMHFKRMESDSKVSIQASTQVLMLLIIAVDLRLDMAVVVVRYSVVVEDGLMSEITKSSANYVENLVI